jgi:hypothetical protein
MINQNNSQTTNTTAAGTLLADSWLEEFRFIDTKDQKLYCRAVHDATLSTQQENSKILLCCFTSLLQIQIFKEHHSEERLVNARSE